MRKSHPEGRVTFDRLEAALAETAGWRYRSRVVFANLDRQSELLRELALEVTGSPIADRPAFDDYFTSCCLHGEGGGLAVHFQSGNYGLGFTITRYALLLAGLASIRTEDRDYDNCAPEGGEFEIAATSGEALERVVAALAAIHASRGVTTFQRSDAILPPADGAPPSERPAS